MKTSRLLCLSTLVLSVGCTTVSTMSKPGFEMGRCKKIAVARFGNPTMPYRGADGGEVMALGLVKRGYIVVDSSSLAPVIDQDDLYESGLTPEIKGKLKSLGVDALVMGTVVDAGCSMAGGGAAALAPYRKSRCRSTVLVKMLEPATGELLWGATATETGEAVGMNEDMALLKAMESIDSVIPEICREPQCGN